METREGIFIFYRNQLEKLSSKQDKLRLASAKIGWLRLFVFLVFASLVYGGFALNSWFFAASLIVFILFLLLIKLHLQKQFEKELGETKIKVIKSEIELFDYQTKLVLKESSYTNYQPILI
jgi:fatty acid desaturase